ncbi:hypothetical protein PUNSTDRAFT_77520 [Punctularia strigosozonata HHB-11173 SS5]|uniref:Endoplasmic reticulum-based factor for assembly of V-ATPase n=1 Tax=Punctularia strigosozonata (strain HHB-11173) TaxID=741275 RepID=R7S0S0_PUNST|nr:uncharacterized protein PUNSTDRAFT_77520 [Punctularia strigosozonata HHB-11173 SS5]EIN03803.1 hypothetical protein PUNSTDRAFT_77520 [Punctularia strigosozonata HHB-11173 SS5]
MTTSDLSVSLEPHLVHALQPLVPLLPGATATKLRALLKDVTNLSHDEQGEPGSLRTKTIPYALLASISQWTRSSDGRAALAGHEPPLDPRAYEMIALLAGARTSPDKTFPKFVPKEREEMERMKRATNDRKVITALLNALLSILGCGFATWYAARTLRWREEWRVLLALLVATVVAISEAVLYIIWQARRNGKLRPIVPPQTTVVVHKEVEADVTPHENSEPIPTLEKEATLRQRRVILGPPDDSSE